METIGKYLFILLLIAPIVAQSQLAEELPQSAIATGDVGIEGPRNSRQQKATNTHQEPTDPAVNKLTAGIQADNSGHQARSERTKIRPAWSDWVEPISILTFLLVLVTIGMLIATMKIVKITRETAKRQLRAYVSARLADGEEVFLDDNECLSTPLIIENYGQTPAYNFRKSAFAGFFRYPLEDALDPPDYRGGSIAHIPPGQKVRMYPTLPRPLNGSEVEAIKTKKGCFCVWGYLEYTDIFNNLQTSGFRMLATGADFERGELAYCEEGNSAT